MEGRGPRGTQARGRAAALAPETPVEKTPALSRRALVARRPRPKSARGASSLRRPRNQDADRCGQSVLVSGLAPSNHFLASLGSVTNPLRLIRYPGRKTPADRCGWFAFRVAPPRRPPAPPQLRSACRAVWRPPAPLLGTSKAFHPVGRAHFKVSCPTSATVMYFRPRGQIYVSEVPGAYLQSRAQPCFQGTAHSAVAPRAWARSLPKPRRHTSPPPRLSPEKVSLPGVTNDLCFSVASASAAPLRRRAGHTTARPAPLAALPGNPRPPLYHEIRLGLLLQQFPRYGVAGRGPLGS